MFFFVFLLLDRDFFANFRYQENNLIRNLVLCTDKRIIKCDKNCNKRLKTYVGHW